MAHATYSDDIGYWAAKRVDLRLTYGHPMPEAVKDWVKGLGHPPDGVVNFPGVADPSVQKWVLDTIVDPDW